MEYVQDSQGQIMVRDEKGNTKYFHKNMIDNLMLMRRYGFTPVPKPIVAEPSAKAEINQEVVNPPVVQPMVAQVIEEQPIVAETTEAKRRGRPAKIK